MLFRSGSAELRLTQGAETRSPAWPQASPGGPQWFPGHPQAKRARFGSCVVRASCAQSALLSIGSRQSGVYADLGELSFEPLDARGGMHGLHLAPWSLGYWPMPGGASVAVGCALLRLLDPT